MLPYMAKESLHMYLRMLGWGDYPVLAEWTINISTAYKRDAEGDLTIVEKKVMCP